MTQAGRDYNREAQNALGRKYANGFDLDVMHRGGTSFKALVNSPSDRLLSTEMVSLGYLEGCFKPSSPVPRSAVEHLRVCPEGEAAGVTVPAP